jgi:hypothetical protein
MMLPSCRPLVVNLPGVHVSVSVSFSKGNKAGSPTTSELVVVL